MMSVKHSPRFWPMMDTAHTLASPCLWIVAPLSYLLLRNGCLSCSLLPGSICLLTSQTTEERKKWEPLPVPRSHSLRGMEGTWELPKLLGIWWVSGYFRCHLDSPQEGRAECSKVLLSFLDLCTLKLPRTMLRVLEALQPWTRKDHSLSLSGQSPKELHKASSSASVRKPQKGCCSFGGTQCDLNLKWLKLVLSQRVEDQGHIENEGYHQPLYSGSWSTHVVQERWGLQKR